MLLLTAQSAHTGLCAEAKSSLAVWETAVNKEGVVRQARVRQALVTCEHAVARLTLLTRLDVLPRCFYDLLLMLLLVAANCWHDAYRKGLLETICSAGYEAAAADKAKAAVFDVSVFASV